MFPAGAGLDRNPGGLQPGADGVPGGVVLPGDLLEGAFLRDVPVVQDRCGRHRRGFGVWWRHLRPVNVELSASHRHPVRRYLVHGADRLVVQAPGDVELGQGVSVQLKGRRR